MSAVPPPSPSPPLPDLNCKRYIAAFPAGPEQQAQDQSDPAGPLQALDRNVPCRTRTASTGSECSPPYLDRKLRSKGPRPTRTASSGLSVPSRTSTASSGSERSPPDLNHKKSPKICQIENAIKNVRRFAR